MKTSEVFSPRRSRIVETGMPTVGVNDVAVRVRACGICGSEYFAWDKAEGAPLRLGHEVAGEVISVGAGVSGIAIGDAVTGLFRRGFSEFTAVDASAVMKYPALLSFDEASLGEPISCVVSGALRTDVGLGKTIAVIGLGFMGLLALQLMKLKGAYHIIAIDARKETEVLARLYGADEFFLPGNVPDKYLLTDNAGTGGVDIVVECTGNAKALDLAVKMLKRHAILSIVGYHQGGPRSVDFQMLNWKAVEIINAHEKRIDHKMRCMVIGLNLVAKAQLRIDKLVTNYYGMDGIDSAFEDFGKKPEGYIKGIVRL
ncbi:MAG: zinc-binding dehydrogenase [Spirochaetales bacterium]|nr:zinc-binding dehydrogenase [Spirochaetales bacterium]